MNQTSNTNNAHGASWLNYPELDGQAQVAHLGRGLSIKSTQWKVHGNLHVRNVRFHPGLRLVFLLSGYEHLRIGNSKIEEKATDRPVGIWLPVGDESLGEKFFVREENLDEFILFISQERLDVLAENIYSLPPWFGTKAQNHLAIQKFQVTSQMVHLIKTFRETSNVNPLMNRLEHEALALHLFQDVCHDLSAAYDKRISVKHEAKTKVDDLVVLLQSGRADNWSLKEMAKFCNTNVTSLQRHFQQIHGTSIWHYLRKVKLQRAHRILLMGGTVSQAADEAGYQHLESFTKAFKQFYGCTPREVKHLI